MPIPYSEKSTYVPPIKGEEKPVKEESVPGLPFSVVVRQDLLYRAVEEYLGMKTESATSTLGGEAHSNMVRLHRFSKINPIDYEDELKRKKIDKLPKVLIHRPIMPLNKERWGEFLSALNRLSDGQDFYMYDKYQSPVTVGYLERVRKIGPHWQVPHIVRQLSEIITAAERGMNAWKNNSKGDSGRGGGQSENWGKSGAAWANIWDQHQNHLWMVNQKQW